MSLKIATILREACVAMPARGIKLIRGGAWYEWDSEPKIIAADATGALILYHDKLPTDHKPPNLDGMAHSKLGEVVQEILGVDRFWLYRFWMGYDRGYQILAVNDKDEESKDDVSEFGISFARELFSPPTKKR
jgi:hypothetical protein